MIESNIASVETWEIISSERVSATQRMIRLNGVYVKESRVLVKCCTVEGVVVLPLRDYYTPPDMSMFLKY